MCITLEWTPSSGRIGAASGPGQQLADARDKRGDDDQVQKRKRSQQSGGLVDAGTSPAGRARPRLARRPGARRRRARRNGCGRRRPGIDKTAGLLTPLALVHVIILAPLVSRVRRLLTRS